MAPDGVRASPVAGQSKQHHDVDAHGWQAGGQSDNFGSIGIPDEGNDGRDHAGEHQHNPGPISTNENGKGKSDVDQRDQGHDASRHDQRPAAPHDIHPLDVPGGQEKEQQRNGHVEQSA